MKTLLRISLAAFALASSAALRADISAQAWLESYYLNPQPAELPRAVERLSREGYFARDENVAVSIGFLGAVFAQNPARVDGWLQALSHLPAREQRLLAAAVWQSGHPVGNHHLRSVAVGSPVRAEVERLAELPPQVLAETSVLSPSSMRLRWGAFLATGHERHVVAILDGFGLNNPRLHSAARMALAQNAAAHPRVLEICRTQLDRQPEDVRSELRAALNAADRTAPRS